MARQGFASMMGAMALVVLAGCGSRPTPPPAEPPIVVVANPLEATIAADAEFTGTTKAVQSVDIKAKVTGYLEDVKFGEGDIVKEGQELFVIDRRQYKAQLDLAEANVNQWKAAYDEAVTEANRSQKLWDRNAVSKEDLDKSIAKRDETKAKWQGAQAQRDAAKLDYEFTVIKAPIAGRVGQADVTKGNLVTAGGINSPPLTTLVSMDPIQVTFDVSERIIVRFRDQAIKEDGPDALKKDIRDFKEKVTIIVPGLDPKEYPVGILDFIDNTVDANTGTIRVRAEVPNGDNLLSPGMFVRVKLRKNEPKKEVLIPDTAISMLQADRIVYVVDEKNIMQVRTVELGFRKGNARVVTKGLSTGDKVIVNGIQRARPGEPCKPDLQDMKNFITLPDEPEGWNEKTKPEPEKKPADDQKPDDKKPAEEKKPAEDKKPEPTPAEKK